jgi:hypothetical protein
MAEFESLPHALRLIQTSWGLSIPKMAALCHTDEATYLAWMKTLEATHTIPSGMEKAVPLVSIYRRLSEKFPEPEDQVKWLTSAHPHFDGNPPFDIALSSIENLAWLSYYLESIGIYRD